MGSTRSTRAHFTESNKMKSTDLPALVGTPFGENGIKTPISQNTSPGTNAASYNDGFPAITMTELNNGGLPPRGSDFNQILYELAKSVQWAGTGALYKFSAEFATKIGGYPKGSKVIGSDGDVYECLTDDNMNDPVGGAGWVNKGEDKNTRELWRRSLAEIGLTLVSGSFKEGATVNSATDAVWDIEQAQCYTWTGDFPHAAEGAPGAGWVIAVAGDIDTVRFVTEYGVTGDGSDESELLQRALNDGVGRVPSGMMICVSDIMIPKTVKIHFEPGSGLIPIEPNFMKFIPDERRYVAGDVAKGATTINYLGDVLPSGLSHIKINRPWVATDDWYNANSEDTAELGYTADMFEVSSIVGNVLTIRTPLPFGLNSESSIQVISTESNLIQGGIIDFKLLPTPQSWSNILTYISNVFFYGTDFLFKGAGGLRFNACHNVWMKNCRVDESGFGGGVFFAYGSTDCVLMESDIEDCYGADAQVIIFAGCRRVISVLNRYVSRGVNTIIGGLYIGAKSVGCKSIDDNILGGRFGIMAQFGAQGFSIIRPILHHQTRAGAFFERCQNFFVDTPDIQYDGSMWSANDETWGALLVRGCDGYELNCTGVPIQALGRMLSIYPYAGSIAINRDITLRLRGAGDVVISTPLFDADIAIDTPGRLYWYQARNVSENINIHDCSVSLIYINAIAYSKIKNNKVVGNGESEGITLTGAESRWNDIDDNLLIDHATGIVIPNTDSSKFSNNIGTSNQFKNVIGRIPVFVTSTDSPIIPYNVVRPPVRGFIISVNNQFNDISVSRTVESFRHSGANGGRKSDWYRIDISENKMPD